MSAVASIRKRQGTGVDAGNILDGPRKRRKDSPSEVEQPQSHLKSASPAPPVQAKKITLKLKKQVDTGRADERGGDSAKTKEIGMKLWTVVKNAKDSK